LTGDASIVSEHLLGWIVLGVGFLIVSRACLPAKYRQRFLGEDAGQVSEGRHAFLSLGGFLLVATGLWSIRDTPTIKPAGTCEFSTPLVVEPAATTTRCYHGAPRRAAT
jgi:hypothetical protein